MCESPVSTCVPCCGVAIGEHMSRRGTGRLRISGAGRSVMDFGEERHVHHFIPAILRAGPALMLPAVLFAVVLLMTAFVSVPAEASRAALAHELHN